MLKDFFNDPKNLLLGIVGALVTVITLLVNSCISLQ